MGKENIKSMLLAILGVIVMGYGIGAISKIGLGADPLTALYYALMNITGLTLGTITAIFNLGMFIIGFVLNRKNVGIATALFIFISKWPVDFGFRHAIVSEHFAVNVILCILALFIIGLGAAFFIVSGLGANAYDSIVLGICDRLNKPDKFVVVKYILDGIALVLAIILKGTIGIGTLLSFALIGVFTKISQKALIKIFKLD
ncbi:MAG: hypothetical protein IJH31_06695 [Erysipelotrichaceae bacterium]|nr:hypothetical protein [Erysipelotrichaceae bacterium]